MSHHGQVLKLKTRGADGKPTWAYRYRVDGRGSARPQVGGFATQGEALQALHVALERLHRRNGRLGQITLSELAEGYLAQHQAEPRTIAKLRWLLAKATGALGDRRVIDLRSDEIGAWRTTLPEGASLRGDPGATPAPQPRGRLEDHRFEPGQGRRRQSAAPTPREAPVRVVGGDQRGHRPPRRSLRADGRVRYCDRLAPRRMDRARASGPRPRREGCLCAQGIRARPFEKHEDAPEHARGAASGDRAGRARSAAGATRHAAPVSGAVRRLPRPAQLPRPRLEARAAGGGDRAAAATYDLRHTFATFALRAGISTFDLSRFMGASLTMIDRHYGHLARDGRQHAVAVLDALAASEPASAAWTFGGRR